MALRLSIKKFELALGKGTKTLAKGRGFLFGCVASSLAKADK
jgi:hypothetical protein